MSTNDYAWPESTTATLLAALRATADADQKVRLARLIGGRS